jgi:hypothetical protein
MQPGRKLKSEWAAAFNGPLTPVTSTQGPPMVQHASPGLSGIQIQPEFANVSIFSYLSYRKYLKTKLFFNLI